MSLYCLATFVAPLFPSRSAGVGAVEGDDKIVFVLVRVPAQTVQAHGIVDEGLHLPRGLDPLPSQQQRPVRGIGYGPLRRHTYPCTGPTPRASKAEVCRRPVNDEPQRFNALRLPC